MTKAARFWPRVIPTLALLFAACLPSFEAPADKDAGYGPDADETLDAAGGDATTLRPDATSPVQPLRQDAGEEGGPTNSPVVVEAGTVPPPLGIAAACAQDADCNSLHCADGVCCDAACTGSCEACNLGTLKGTCSPVAANQQPATLHPSCAVANASTCGQDGTCDGRGNCKLWGNATPCGSASCNGGTNVFANASTCDGAGHCVQGSTASCAPFTCNGTAACKTTCAAGTDCAGEPCLNNSCGTVANGSKCTSGSQCTSTNCVDGYCCDGACAGACQACDVAGHQGTCTTVAAGTPHGARSCVGSGTCLGSCSGSSATCAYPKAACASQSCTAGVVAAASSCDGAGHCAAQATSSCGGYACNGAACFTTCTSDSACASPTPYCNTSTSHCQATAAQGHTCSQGTQCGTGNCVNGVCCGSAACTATDACHTAGTCTAGTGVCTNPTGNEGASCGGGNTCSSGSCICSGTMCSGVCVNPTTDANNCGSCGHGCLGAGCQGGRCAPIVLGTEPGNGEGVALDGTSVYFTTASSSSGKSVFKCPLSGCGTAATAINSSFMRTGHLHYSSSSSALYVADNEAFNATSITTSGGLNWTSSTLNDPQGMTDDASFLYVGDQDQIDKIDKGTGALSVLVGGINGYVWGVAYDAATSRVYGAVFGSNGPGEIVSCPTSGAACTSLPLSTGGNAFDILVVGSQVYWVDSGDGSNGNTNGGLFTATTPSLTNVQAMAQSGTTYGFALALTSDASSIYFTGGNSGDVYQCAIAGCGGTPTIMATGQGSARAIVNDSSAVYWVNDAGQLVKVAK
jgi:hypothetical protein